MSSRRFPGKMLAPFAGRPLIDWLLGRLAGEFGRERLVLATSLDPTDAPLAVHAQAGGYTVFRGVLDDVLARFQACARAHPASWIVRICGDSPLLDPGLVTALLGRRAEGLDLVTNVAHRSFPPGQSVEVMRSETLQAIDSAVLDPSAREHLTQVFYRTPGRFRVLNVEGADPSWPNLSYVVDTLEDLRRLEPLAESGAFPVFRPVSV